MRIAIILGTTRPGRKAETVARWVYEIAERRTDADFELVDLADFDLPHLDERLPPSLGQYSQAHTRRWARKIAEFDAYVFVTPEYNHGPPSTLKNAIDFVCAEWRDKAAGFVSYGYAGGVRAVQTLRLVMGSLKVADVASQVTLSLHADFENFTQFSPAPHQEQSVTALLDELVAWGTALKSLRTPGLADGDSRPPAVAA